jgi:hypothetical protein
VRYDGAAKAAYCATYVGSNKLTAANTSGDFSCNPDFNVYHVGLVTLWTPVKNLTFSADVQYFRLDQNFHRHSGPDPIGPEARDGLRVQGPGRGLAAGSRPCNF